MSNEDKNEKEAKKKNKRFSKAFTITAILSCVPTYVAAMVGIACINYTASRPGNNKKQIVKESSFYASSFILPNPICEVVGFVGRL